MTIPRPIRRIIRALFGYLIFDNRGGTPIEGLPAQDPFLMRAWWGDEDFPVWWNYVASWIRHAWYRSAMETCACPGCEHLYPKWWATPMCKCCCNEDCCHGDET